MAVMPPTLVTTDLHLSASPKDAYRLRLFGAVQYLMKKHKADTLYILGDITEAKDRHTSALVNQIVDGIGELMEHIKDIFILAGNHDSIGDGIPFFRFVREIPGVHFITEPDYLLNHSGPKHVMLPFTRNPERDWSGLNFANATHIFAHQTFAGAYGENGRALDGIPLSLLPRIPIISGDVHVPQQFENVTYVGAPYHIDYGDSYEPRMLLLDHRGRQEWIIMEGPRKVVIHARSVKDVESQLRKRTKEGDMVRVEIQLERGAYPEWSEMQTKARTIVAGLRCTVDSVIPVVGDDTEGAAEAPRLAAPLNDMEVLNDFCGHRSVDDATAKVGREFL